MSNDKQIVVNGEELIMALESHIGEGRFILDRETGEVIPLLDEGFDGGEDDGLRALVEADDGTRFVQVEPISSHEGWNVMRDFVDQLPAGKAADRLTDALAGKSPFRRFKDALRGFPQVEEQWFPFHAKALYALAEEWLKDNDIEATLQRRQGV